MQKLLKTISIATVAALALTPAAFAAHKGAGHTHVLQNDVVIDARNNPVVTATGDCVYTKWQDNGSDKCTRFSLTLEERTVYFEFDKSSLTADARRKLDYLIKRIRGARMVESVSLVGYADKLGTDDYNERLSRARALSVKKYLQKGSVKTRNVEVRALGESRPTTSCHQSNRKELIACLQPDRRVEVELNLVK